MEEIEVKFLNIDPAAIEEKLKKIGAKKVADFFYKRYIFDYPNLSLHKRGAWVRLRTDGKETTLTYKQRLGMSSHDGSTSDTGMEEIEVLVSDFEKAAEMFRKMGFMEKFYEENKRVRWMKDDIEFDLDFWPHLSPYLEIEAPSWQKIDEAIKILGLNPEDKKIFSVAQVYQLAGINQIEYSRITFNEFTKREDSV